MKERLITEIRRRWQDQRWRRAALLVLLAFAGYKAFVGIRSGLRNSWDLQWDGAWGVLHHISPFEAQDPQTLARFEEKKRCLATPLNWEALKQRPYSPGSLLLFAPLACFDWPTARALWVAAQLLLSGLFLWVVRELWLRDLPSKAYWVAAGCLLAMAKPWWDVMISGQVSIFCLAFFMLALLQLDRGRRFLASLCLILALVKFSLILPLCWVFARRRAWDVLAIALVATALLFFASAGWLGMAPGILFHEWINLLGRYLGGQGASPDFMSWCVEFLGQGLGKWLGLVLAGIAFLSFLALDWYGRLDEVMALALLTQLLLLFSYHRTYDYVVLVFAAVVAWRSLHFEPGRGLALMIAWVWYWTFLIRQTGFGQTFELADRVIMATTFLVITALLVAIALKIGRKLGPIRKSRPPRAAFCMRFLDPKAPRDYT
jgi:hypothetical protein